jgi:hypothetical protein
VFERWMGELCFKHVPPLGWGPYLPFYSSEGEGSSYDRGK